MKYKAVIFDMDGTLINTLQDIGEASNRVLALKNFPLRKMNEYKNFVGEGARRLIEKALPEGESSENLINECLKMFFKEYDQTWNLNSQLYSGIKELLDELEILPISKSILSNKPDEFTKACSNEYLSKWKFDKVLGNSDQIPRKPDPSGAISIASDLNISPDQFIFVGDTKIDMKTALGAGMMPIGVLWGFRSLKELVDNGAAALLSHPIELLDYIG